MGAERAGWAGKPNGKKQCAQGTWSKSGGLSSNHTLKVRNNPYKNMISKPTIIRKCEDKYRILEMH